VTELRQPKVLAFDVFGTVVDWFGSIAREVDALRLGVPGADFARAWRAGYRPAMDRVRCGDLPWTRIDDLHRLILDEILLRFGIASLNEEQKRHLNRAWHRLDPWPDAVPGLTRLRRRHTLCTLSNGNVSLLVDMAKRAGLPWDCVLSAETFHRYKPDPETYLGTCRLLDVRPAEMMMVAAHPDDLAAARACGCATAYVDRPLEFGPGRPREVGPDGAADLRARDLEDLADQLGCPRG
jgi:2-haloacid dehalogenase